MKKNHEEVIPKDTTDRELFKKAGRYRKDTDCGALCAIRKDIKIRSSEKEPLIFRGSLRAWLQSLKCVAWNMP